MVEVLKVVPAILVVGGPPLIAALTGHALMGLGWPALFCGLAVLSTVSDGENYDMPEVELHVYGAAAVVAVLALVLGAGIRRLRT